jgi:hypothetical protein
MQQWCRLSAEPDAVDQHLSLGDCLGNDDLSVGLILEIRVTWEDTWKG